MMRSTKTYKLLELFKTRKRIGVTCHDSVTQAGYHRLAAFVYDMKKKGYQIESQWETDTGGTKYKRYWLKEAVNDPIYGQEKSAETLDGYSANSGKTSQKKLITYKG